MHCIEQITGGLLENKMVAKGRQAQARMGDDGLVG